MMKIHFNARATTFLIMSLLTLVSNSDAQSQKSPTMLWKHKTNDAIVAGPASDGKNIFIGSYDSSFYCLNLATGKVNWKIRTGGPIGSTAALWQNRIFFYSGDGNLYCVNPSNGQLNWKFKTLSGALPDRRYDWPDYYHSSPLVVDTVVYFGAGDGRIYAVNASDGKLKWNYQTGDVVHTKPAYSNGKVVVGSFDGHMYCLNSETGALVWRFKTTGQRYFPKGEVNGNPVIHKDKVIFGARDYNLYALDLNAGYCHWLKTFPYGWALPVTPNDTVLYVGTSDDRLLLAVNESDGVIRWRRNLGFNNFAALAIDGTRGYTGTLNGKVFGVDLTSGEILWTFTTDAHTQSRNKYFKPDDNYVDNIASLLPNGNAILNMYKELGAVFSQPIVVDGKLIVASNDGMVYCLRVP